MIQTLMFSQALFLFLLSFKFFKANVIEILIWNFLSSNTLSFLRLNSSTSNFCAAFLLTATLSQNLQSPNSDQYHSEFPWKSVHQAYLNAISSVNMWSTWLWIFPSGEVQVCLWMFWCENIRLLTTRFFYVAKLNTVTSLSLLSRCKFSFQIVSLKISSPQFCIKMFILYFSFNSSQKLFLSHHFSPQLVHMHSEQWYYTSDISEYMTS